MHGKRKEDSVEAQQPVITDEEGQSSKDEESNEDSNTSGSHSDEQHQITLNVSNISEERSKTFKDVQEDRSEPLNDRSEIIEDESDTVDREKSGSVIVDDIEEERSDNNKPRGSIIGNKGNRRSTRQTKKRTIIEPSMTGKTHGNKGARQFVQTTVEDKEEMLS